MSSVPTPMLAPRPVYWSIRRELFENRFLYIAPLVVTAVILFATSMSMIGLPRRMRNAGSDPVKQQKVLVSPFAMAPAPVMLVTLIIGFFYSIDALYGERRDRSILFWKSLPVSDTTTVLTKMAIPVIVLPLIAFVLGVFTQRALIILGSMVLAGSGSDPSMLWTQLPSFQEAFVAFYGIAVHALWFAPIYAWLLLVSAWAKRAPFLWAVLPVMLTLAFERIVSTNHYFFLLLRYRIVGAMEEAFAVHGHDTAIIRLSQLEPLRFLSSWGLWTGLILTALFIVITIRIRRYREPI